jgi:hypothetical protein
MVPIQRFTISASDRVPTMPETVTMRPWVVMFTGCGVDPQIVD